ncbi:hypothetical protein BC628DRAFT_463556 [Trametes gibbosa]|nr:hypothetical protein BC628DRAFT_463556 [Trametes gibbosa]
MNKYRLKPSNLQDLPFTTKETVAQGKVEDTYLCMEREVERKAWERHGSPENCEAYLAELRSQYTKRYGDCARYNQPMEYTRPLVGLSIVQLRPLPSVYD